MRKSRSGKRPTAPAERAGVEARDTRGSSTDAGMLTVCQSLSNERYEAFVENIQEGVYEVDIHGNFLYFNNALCKVLGYPREEIQFHNVTKFLDAAYRDLVGEVFHTIRDTREGVSGLVWGTRDRRGRVRVIESSVDGIFNQEGALIGFRGIARNITKNYRFQETLRRSERRFRTLLDFLPYPAVVFTLTGKVTYLNPAFTEVFGWTRQELEGKKIPYVPPGVEDGTGESIRRHFVEKKITRLQTRRLTKEGRVLDVVLRATAFVEGGDGPSGLLVIHRDITQEKRIARNNAALLRISVALPKYPDLGALLDYISEEVKRLLDCEGALVILLDEERMELYFEAAAHDDEAAEKKLKTVRFPADKGVSGRVIRTRCAVRVDDVTGDPDFYSVVDLKAGFKTRNLLDVPLEGKEGIVGVLCAMNKRYGAFDRTDEELLSLIAGTVSLSIENARVSHSLKEAYEEVTSLNRAKDRVINHLSHELKTPLAVLSASLNILGKRLKGIPEEGWHPTIERAQRNLGRILELQYEVEDIMRRKRYDIRRILFRMVGECADVLAAVSAEEVGEGPLVERLRKRLEDIFGLREEPREEIAIHRAVQDLLEETSPLFSHRRIDLVTTFVPVPSVSLPSSVLRKVFVGLLKNAVENTPDEGRVEVSVLPRGRGAELRVRDYGVGITLENRKHIFEGFFMTQDVLDYSSRNAYDFNAGGKGADLLRTRIFSERYGFHLEMTSVRCAHIPLDRDVCPGRISLCLHCKAREDCHASGGTVFTLFFPPAAKGADPDTEWPSVVEDAEEPTQDREHAGA